MSAPPIDTPALLLDLERLQRNLSEMAEMCRAHGRTLRPHVKSHKTVEIAERQRELGAVGLDDREARRSRSLRSGRL